MRGVSLAYGAPLSQRRLHIWGQDSVNVDEAILLTGVEQN